MGLATLSSTLTFISLKPLFYSNATTVGGREQWTIAVSPMGWCWQLFNHLWKYYTGATALPEGKDREYLTTATCMNAASEQRCRRVRSDILIDSSFWSEQNNTGNFRHFCHAFTVLCCLSVKSEYIHYHPHGILFIKSKHLIQIQAPGSPAPRNSQFIFHNLSYKQIQKEQYLLDLASQRLRGNMSTAYKIIPWRCKCQVRKTTLIKRHIDKPINKLINK